MIFNTSFRIRKNKIIEDATKESELEVVEEKLEEKNINVEEKKKGLFQSIKNKIPQKTKNNIEEDARKELEATEETFQELNVLKQNNSKKSPYTHAQFELPKRLWHKLLEASNISENQNWADLNNLQLQNLAEELTNGVYKVNGKSTFKEEFVTAGGISLKDINFKTFESKLHKNLYFSGEVLNIDAITGGFNFQNAWTGGFMVAKSIIQKG